jgi:hypothetical protein
MRQLKDNPNYLVTLDGRVFSLYSMRYLTLHKNDNGYLRVKIDGKLCYIHRLVAQTYLPNPENKATVNHMDGDKYNNMLCNLEWATASENMKHACDTGLKPVSDLMRETGRLMQGNLRKGYNPDAAKLVLDFETGIYYESATEAAETIGVKPKYLWKRLNGELKNTTKFKYV